ncbi:MAG TPA: M61 family peptidase [Candidatus Polarisedimenticolia bacterium]|nr:M61 family peptidase [Candidatus Polarisedimenticolia bacterium]
MYPLLGRRSAFLVLLMVLAAGGVRGAASSSGPIELSVDASEVPRKILHVKMSMAIGDPNVRLLYPKWIPGEHGPTGPIKDVTGIKVTVQGKPVRWSHVSEDVNTLQIEAPSGAGRLEVAFDTILPPSSVEGFSSAASSTDDLLVLAWNQVLLYPAGSSISQLKYKANLTLPEGWKLATALPIATHSGRTTRFGEVTLETLVDSPVLCGVHMREIPLGVVGGVPHFVEMAADSEAALEPKHETRESWGRLVREGQALFGARHYNSYRFLLTLSDGVAHFGLEHHESSDDRTKERMLLDEELTKSSATLLPHEYVHSWNGKYRRPEPMVTDDFQGPLDTSMLWVYEGLTQYLGQILTARSGLWTQEDFRDKLALIAEWAANQTGRAWRPLEDTALSAQLLFEARDDWESWRRGTDFYDESVLIWLDADTLIREKTGGKKSLTDFCRLFHGGASGAPQVRPYTFEDLVATLDEVMPYDWSSFLRQRVESTSPYPPLEGLTRSGWRLIYAKEPSEVQKDYDASRKEVDLTASLGLVIREDGTIKDMIMSKPAYKAGLGPGMKIIAVNGMRYSKDRIREAVAESSGSDHPIDLVVENGEAIKSYRVDYKDGAKYPRLERIPGKKDLLSQITESRAS